MTPFTLRQLEYFVACYDNRSIAAAAEAIQVTQPTISIAITKLESQLDTQLFIRHHSQGISPTASANLLVQSARSLLSGAAEFQEMANSTHPEIAGTLTLGSFISLAPRYLPGLLAKLQTDHPQFHLRIKENTQDQLTTALLRGDIEMALMYNINLAPELSKTHLSKAAPYVALPADHPFAHHSSIELTALANEPLILFDVEPSRAYFLGLLNDAGVTPNVAFSSPSLELVRGMVGKGFGYSLLVTKPASNLSYTGEKVVAVPISNATQASEIVLAKVASLRHTKLMQTLEDSAIDYFSSIPS